MCLTNIILNDHAPTQICLHSIPIVSYPLRLYQMNHCWENYCWEPVGNLGNLNNVNQADIAPLNEKSERIRSYFRTGNLIQLTIAISLIALCIFVPLSVETLILVSLVGALALWNLLLVDRFMDPKIILKENSNPKNLEKTIIFTAG